CRDRFEVARAAPRVELAALGIGSAVLSGTAAPLLACAQHRLRASGGGSRAARAVRSCGALARGARGGRSGGWTPPGGPRRGPWVEARRLPRAARPRRPLADRARLDPLICAGSKWAGRGVSGRL